MKKIFIILFALFFTINFANANSDRWGWNDRPAPSYRADLEIKPTTNLEVDFNFEWTCNSESKSKFPKRFIPWNFLNANISWVGCNRQSDWKFLCRTSWWFWSRNKIERNAVISISNSNLFSNSWLPLNLSWNLIQSVSLEMQLVWSNFLRIQEWDSIFKAIFNREFPNQKTTCNVSCKDICVRYSYSRDDERRCIEYKQETNVNSCNEIKNELITPTPIIKVWNVSPRIVDVKFSWGNCKWDSCYAWEEFKIDVKVEEWTPSGVNVIRTYVLNEEWTNCYKDVTSWNCPYTDLWATWWILKTEWLKKVWVYTIETNAFVINSSWTVINRSEPRYTKIKIVPNPEKLTWIIKSESEKNKTNWKIYANYVDSYKYEIEIKDKYDNLIKNKKVLFLECKDQCINDQNWLKWINPKNFVKNTNLNWITDFDIVSAVPNHNWSEKPSFNWEVQKWDPQYIDIYWQKAPLEIWNSIDKKIFEEPILYDKVAVQWNNINVSKLQKYDIKLKNEWNLTNYSNWKISPIQIWNIFLSDTLNYSFENNNLVRVQEVFWNNILNWSWFTVIIKSLKNLEIKGDITVKLKDLFMSYNLNKDSKNFSIKYSLRNLDWFDWCAVNTTWLVINGKSISKWKENYTSELNTFSNISKSDLKKIIDKNAKDLIRWLKSWEKANWVLYYEWDVTYSSVKSKLSENDSLIIKNWNLFIDQNVEKNIWIVVLNNNFKPEINSSNKWNIFVKNTVTKIEAYLYSDGGLISAKSLNWEKYTDEELRQHRLDLVWSLISSNTVWGWEKWDSNYLLPWNKVTNNWELAERYDLNYIRKHIITCDVNNPNNYSFKVEYNPAIQSKTPKVFRNN